MLELCNSTPFGASIVILPDAEGVDTLYLAVRAVFSIQRGEPIAGEPATPRVGDAHWGDPASSSVRYPGEVHLQKPSTDVILVGHAWAMGGRAVPTVDAALAVGAVRKVIRVFGEREWRGALDARIGAPAPFEKMPLVYERAFGGTVELDSATSAATVEPRNPVGMGFARRSGTGEITARKLPNLEDPANLIADPRSRPPPAGFGAIAPAWEPRRLRAGTYGERWRKSRAPFLPADFDARFFNAAHPDLICKGHLQGGEEVSALHVTPAPLLRFRLPVCRFDVRVHVRGAVFAPPLLLETVLIEPDEDRLSLLFRGALRCDKDVLRISRVDLGIASLSAAVRAA